ncbi:MAG: hypothetical protein LBU47_00510, partial [Christensenellaceae bacterium]|nr:hypothetical protein [Christensenellaceae bacterium]
MLRESVHCSSVRSTWKELLLPLSVYFILFVVFAPLWLKIALLIVAIIVILIVCRPVAKFFTGRSLLRLVILALLIF